VINFLSILAVGFFLGIRHAYSGDPRGSWIQVVAHPSC